MKTKIILAQTISHTTKTYIDSKKQKWSIYTEEEMFKKYPNGGYRVLGDFNEKNSENVIGQLILDKQSAYIQRYLGNAPRGYYVVGYIPGQSEDEYIRILKKKRGRVLAALAIIFLLITIFLGGLWLGNAKRPVDTPVKIKTGQLTNPNPTNIRLPGIEKIYAKVGEKRVEQTLLNVQGNAYDLTYVIALAKTGEVLYTSKTIQPGYGIKAFNLKRTFKKGEYPITITVNSSAQQDREKKDKNKKLAYNAGKLNATLIVE